MASFPKKTTSVLGKSVVNKISSFIEANGKAMESDATPEDGAKALANAIAYGVCLALSDAKVQSAFSAGVCPPAGGPVGTLIFSPLQASTKES